MRVSAYRLTPKKDNGYKETDLLVVDGERVPYEPIEVSVGGHFMALSLHDQNRHLPAASQWS